jgi:hypothetical protein
MQKLSFEKIVKPEMLQFLEEGQTVLTRIRAVNKMGYDPSKSTTEMVPVGRKMQIEAAEKISNPTIGGNPLLAALNQGDDRFSGQKPRYGWLIAEVAILAGLMDGVQGKSAKQWEEVFNKLEISTGVAPDEREEGKHIVSVNLLNPAIGKDRLRVEIQETTTKANERQQFKINPSTGEAITHNGQKIYTNPTIVAGEPRNVFLMPDREDAPASQISVSLTQKKAEEAGVF